MIWIAPSEKDHDTAALEKKLWDATDKLHANSGPILGLIFLRFAEVRFAAQRARLEKASAKGRIGNLPHRGSQGADGTSCVLQTTSQMRSTSSRRIVGE